MHGNEMTLGPEMVVFREGTYLVVQCKGCRNPTGKTSFFVGMILPTCPECSVTYRFLDDDGEFTSLGDAAD